MSSSLGGDMITNGSGSSKKFNLQKIIITRGLLVDLLSSFIFSILSISLTIMLEFYTPGDYIDYYLRFSSLILMFSLLITRRLRIPIITQIPLHIGLFTLSIILLKSFTIAYSNVPSGVMFTFILILNVIYSFVCIANPRTGKLKFDGALLALIVNMLLFIPLSFLEDDIRLLEYNRLFVNIFLIFIAFFIARQISEFEDGYYHSIRSSSVPISRIRRQNIMTISGVFIGSLIALIPLIFIPVDWLKKAVGYYIARIIRAILSFFARFDRDITVSDEILEIPEMPEEEEYFMDPTLQKMFKVLLVIAAIVFVYALIKLIIKLVRKLLKGGLNKVPEVTSSEYVTDTIEKLDSHKIASRHHSLDFGKGYERTIRKRFYNITRHAIKHDDVTIKESFSPNEIKEAIKGKSSLSDSKLASLEELTTEYQKVRY